MLAQIVALFGAMILALSLAIQQPQEISFLNELKGEVAARNFWAYQSATASYIYSNPAATGTVADTNLTFPTGYIRNPAWTNIIQGGTLYTYSTATLPAHTISRIAKLGGNSLMIGLANNGTMTSLSGGATGFLLPAAIPNGAVVTIGN
jgi:hypothetical protein